MLYYYVIIEEIIHYLIIIHEFQMIQIIQIVFWKKERINNKIDMDEQLILYVQWIVIVKLAQILY